MSRIKEEDKINTKNKILEASERMFIQQGYDQTTTKAIAQACHIAEGTIFNYFKSKDDILVTIFENQLHTQLNTIDDEDVVNFNALIEQIIKPFNQLRVIPKKLMIDIIVIAVKKMKKKPSYMDRLAAMDYRYMAQIETLIKPLLKPSITISTHEISEIIYGSLFVELMMYLYHKEQSFEVFKTKVKQKVLFILNPCLIGGN